MECKEKNYQAVMQEVAISDEALQETAAAFRCDIESGLRGRACSSLRLLPSYLALPDKPYQGQYVALDFGGTNVRAALIVLDGKGGYKIERIVAKPLKVDNVYDFTGRDTAREDLFGFLAGMIDEAIAENHSQPYLLGHTFSFPSAQQNLGKAQLLAWTKEFAVEGVAGEDINGLLQEALVKEGLSNVQPAAVINDTVAVQLAAAYADSAVCIGSIYATGFNASYLESYADKAAKPQILNLEAGRFSKLMPSCYDNELDDLSADPGEQRLEKMVSGRYLGRLFSLALADCWHTKEDFSFTSRDLSVLLQDDSVGMEKAGQLLAVKTGRQLTLEEAAMVRDIARTFTTRSARLAAAVYAGILWHLGTDKERHIAVDGALYAKLPQVQEVSWQALSMLLEGQTAKLQIFSCEGGSLVGAALAAAMA